MTELRVSELARAQGKTIADIAKEIGISRVNLSNSLNGNPTLSRLKEVAAILHVEVAELFRPSAAHCISGYLECDGEITRVDSIEAVRDFITRFDKSSNQF